MSASLVGSEMCIRDRQGAEGWRPRGLMPNGDTLEQIAELIRERGRGATHISKTKGHALQEHIDKGLSAPWQLAGNARADALTHRAKEPFSTIQDVLEWGALQVRRYADVVFRVQAMMVAILKEAS
eukprot:735705-Alexandrium_andersonii.AAC.1